jgi:hypothetical protein
MNNKIIANMKMPYLLWLIAIIDLLAAIMHFVFHIELMQYHDKLSKFLIVENLIIGFIALYISMSIILGNINQKKGFLFFSLSYWITSCIVVLIIQPDVTTASMVKEYMPIKLSELIYILLYFGLQIIITAYAILNNQLWKKYV